jgi:hypothetical protein
VASAGATSASREPPETTSFEQTALYEPMLTS